MKITFSNSYGDRLVGILENPTASTHVPVVVLVHGFASHKDTKSWPPLIKKLHEQSIATFKIDLYARGESEGNWENLTVSRDVACVMAAIDYLQNQGFKQIGLVGSSFGGLSSIMTVSQRDDISFLALKCPVIDWSKNISLQKPGILEQWQKTGFHCFEHEPGKPKISYAAMVDAKQNNGFDVVDKIKTPVLIVHGDRDEMVPYDTSVKFSKMLKNGKLHPIHGCGHMFAQYPEYFAEVNQVLSDFITQQVSSAES